MCIKKIFSLLVLIIMLSSCGQKKDIQALSKAITLPIEDISRIIDLADGSVVPLELDVYHGFTGIAVESKLENSDNLGRQLRALYGNRGIQIFLAKNYFGQDDRNNVFWMIKSDDPYDILRIKGTNYIEKGITTEQLITILKDMEVKFNIKFTFTAAELAWIHADISEIPTSFELFVKELVSLSPELLNDGTGRIEDIQYFIKENLQIYLLLY